MVDYVPNLQAMLDGVEHEESSRLTMRFSSLSHFAATLTGLAQDISDEPIKLPTGVANDDEAERRSFSWIADTELALKYARLVKFMFGTRWEQSLEDVLEEHSEAAIDHFGLVGGRIVDAIGEDATAALWMCALNDLATRVFNSEHNTNGESNLVDEFLDRDRQLPVHAQAYLRALQTSIMSLYEVMDVQPGVSLLIRDLVRSGEPVLVAHRSGVVSFARSERIGARILTVAGKSFLADAVIKYSYDGSEALIKGLRTSKNELLTIAELPIGNEHLRDLGYLFSVAWLSELIPKATGQVMPVLLNTIGKEILFHCIRFSLVSGTGRSVIAAKLARIPGLNREDEASWVWLGHLSGERPSIRKRQWSLPLPYSWTENGAPVLGYIELVDTVLMVFVTSATQAKRATALFGEMLGDLAGVPSTVVATMDQAFATFDRGD